MTYTRSQIRENRMKWINFLMTKGRKKAIGVLDVGEGKRCCLGHGCFVLGVPKQKMDDGAYSYESETSIPPDTFWCAVGLYANDGEPSIGRITIRKMEFSSLADANDKTENPDYYSNNKINITPRQIGAYLLSVIEGGEKTPFYPLTDYPE